MNRSLSSRHRCVNALFFPSLTIHKSCLNRMHLSGVFIIILNPPLTHQHVITQHTPPAAHDFRFSAQVITPVNCEHPLFNLFESPLETRVTYGEHFTGQKGSYFTTDVQHFLSYARWLLSWYQTGQRSLNFFLQRRTLEPLLLVSAYSDLWRPVQIMIAVELL